MMQYSDIIFGDQNEWEIASGVPHIPFEALDADYEIAKEAYLEYFRKMHQLFPKCKKMLMAVRNHCQQSSYLERLAL